MAEQMVNTGQPQPSNVQAQKKKKFVKTPSQQP